MRILCGKFALKSLRTDLLCLPLLEGNIKNLELQEVDKSLGRQIAAITKRRLFSGKKGEHYSFVPHPTRNIGQILLIGMGKEEDVTIDRVRKAAGIGGQKATSPEIKTVAIVVAEWKAFKKVDASEITRAVVEGVNLGSYFLDRYKSGNDKRSKPATLRILFGNSRKVKQAQTGSRPGLIVSDLQNYCRDLAGAPANVVTPTYLANEAQKIGRKHGLKVQVLGRNQIKKLKMGAFLGVAKASVEPPYLIRIDYKPKVRAKKRVVLIGKGITFDSGGITLKPGADMHEMKQDMSGAAAVLGTMAAVAQLKPKVQVTAFIPTCENMPGGRAYRPGDVLTTSIGKTIEVISTDAEGRLLLADVLGYASSKIKPDYLIDIATLTGAVIVALGHAGAAMLSNSDALIEKFQKASSATGEKVWQLPLWEEYEHQLSSPIADMKNSFGRPGGTSTAALMLKKFTGDVPWLHLDIAGMDLEYRGTEYTPKGASGFGMRLMTEFFMRL